MGEARLAVQADPALVKQIRDSVEQARAEGNLSRVQRELSKLLELYPNEPVVRAPIYLAMAEASMGLGDDAKAQQYRAVALAIDPHAAEWHGNEPASGENRGQKADKILGFISLGLQVATQIQQARQQGAANSPQLVGQPQQQMNAFPQAPVGMQGAPPVQMQQGAPGGFAGSPGMVVVGYDANNQPIYAPAQQVAQPAMQMQPGQQMQPANGMYPAPPTAAGDPAQQMGQMPAQPQSAYPAAPQGQAQPAYLQQQPYPQQQPQAYPQQQPYPQQQQTGYPAQQPYPQQQPYPTQQGYPAPIGAPNQQPPYGGTGTMRAPGNPYAPPANYGRRAARGDQTPPIKIFYDRSHAGDSAYFSDPCRALVAVDEAGALTVTPGCGQAPLVIPASEIVDLRMNVAVGKPIGAFHIATARGLYLMCTSDSGTTDQSHEVVRSLKQQLKMTD
jgi:hypothetical protein